jgi:uncharacterized membrane protein
MWERLDKYIAAIWKEGKLRAVATLVLLALVVIVVLVLLGNYVGADLGGYVNRLLGQ